MNAIEHRIFALILVFCGMATSLPGAELPVQRPGEELPLPSDFELIGPEQMILEESIEEAGRNQRLFFVAWNRPFDLRLQPSKLFMAGATTVWVDAQGNSLEEPPLSLFFEGIVEGDPDSFVRLDMTGGVPQGLISTGDELYFLESAGEHIETMSSPGSVIYRLSDLEPFWGEHQCGSEGADPTLWETPLVDWSASTNGSDHLSTVEFPGAFLEVEIQLVIDSYFYARYGPDASRRVHGLIHSVNGIFERELGVTFRIAGTRVSLSRVQDSVSATTDPEGLLDEFVAGQPQQGADLAHLFTGRDLNGPTIGLSWTGSVCNTPYGSGISQSLQNSGLQVVLTAHELGHNLGASHDGSGVCRDVSAGYVMWPVVQGNRSSFSGCSKKSIQRNLGYSACLSPLSPHPLPAPQPVNPLSSVSWRDLVFMWEETRGANGYFLEVLDQDTAGVVYSKKVSDTHLYPALSLEYGETYFWRIAALDKSGLGDRTSWQPFSVYASSWHRKPR